MLVSGLTTSLIDERGGDHTTNGIRMGLDGWIYIAVGDYGFHGAKGKDGTTLSQRGGGILRVRPDGTELEVFAIGLRNPFAIAIDPFMNLFTRDNTNDGAGWDVRVSHLIQTADYGYPLRFANFPDEIMPPLGAYGQGGGTGALSLQDRALARSLSRLAAHGRLGPERGLPARPEARRRLVPQPIRASSLPSPGRRAWTSAPTADSTWRAGAGARPPSTSARRSASSRASPRPAGARARPSIPGRLALAELIDGLCGPNAASRFHCQREIMRRGPSPETTRALTDLASDASSPLHARVAALFALKQVDGTGSHGVLRKLAGEQPSASSRSGRWPTARRSSPASMPRRSARRWPIPRPASGRRP